MSYGLHGQLIIFAFDGGYTITIRNSHFLLILAFYYKKVDFATFFQTYKIDFSFGASSVPFNREQYSRRNQRTAALYSRWWGFPGFKYQFKPKRVAPRQYP
jgi:hypothetical protein